MYAWWWCGDGDGSGVMVAMMLVLQCWQRLAVESVTLLSANEEKSPTAKNNPQQSNEAIGSRLT